MRADRLKSLFGPLVAAVFMLCAAPARAELPPAAQAAFDKGVVAAQQQEWEIASQSFQEARKAAPDAPEILYNLGLAESKMPGRELRAIAWFGAYLSADPGAANAKNVWDYIAALQVKNEGDIRRLIKTLESGVKDIPGSLYSGEEILARLWAGLGDIPDTDRLVASAIADDSDSNANVDRREGEFYNGPRAIARFNAGDLAGAEEYVARIPRPRERTDVGLEMAKIQLTSGDVAGARATLSIAAAAAGAIPLGAQNDPTEKAMEQSQVATAQARAGDLAGAEATILAAQKVAEMTTNPSWKDFAEAEIGGAQAAAGDIAGAQKTDAIVSETYAGKALLEDNIEIAQARPRVNGSSVATGPTAALSDWIAMLDIDSNVCDPHHVDRVKCLNGPLFLNFAGSLKSQTSGDPSQSYYAIVHAADRLIGTRYVLDGMLRRLADHSPRR